MGAQGVHLGGSLLVKGAEERKEEAVLVEPSRPSACVDHALLQSPARTSGSLDFRLPRISLSIFFLSLWLFIFSTFAAFASALHRFFSGWAGVGQRPGASASHATADATVYHQNLLLQFSRKLSWLGSCLAPPCRGLRPTPALCAPSRGCDEPVARHCLPRSADEVRAMRRG